MIKKSLILTVLFFFILSSYTARAITPDSFRDNSCLSDNTLIGYLLVQLGTLGYQMIVDEAFKMKGASNDNCNNTADNFVNFEYNTLGGKILDAFGDLVGGNWNVNKYKLKDGDKQIFVDVPFAVLRGKAIADKNCVQILTLFGYQNLGCKYRIDTSRLSDAELATYSSAKVDESCFSDSEMKSQALFPITSRVVQCTVGTLDRLFDTSPESNTPAYSIAALHNNMKTLAKIMLVLCVVMYGLRVSLSNSLLGKKEVFMLFAKIIFVVWFSIGIGKNNATVNLYTNIRDTTAAFSNLIQNSSSSSGLCQYDYGSVYGTNKVLPMFDSLDCRLLHYFMIDVDFASLSVKSVAFFKMLVASLFSAQLLFFILMLVFAIFFLSAIVFFTCFYLVCSIMQAILVYFSPIFVPFILFNFTKEYFTSWVRLIISYSIQPAVIMVFISLMLTLFDQSIYGNCVFKKTYTTIPYYRGMASSVPKWELGLPTFERDKCINTIGWQFSGEQGIIDSMNLVFFSIDFIKPTVVEKLLYDIITLVLLSAVLYGFSTVINGFAADLAGGSSLESIVGRPTALAEKVGEAARAVGGKIREKLTKG